MISQISPVLAIVTMIAGVVGAFVGVKITAASAKESATRTAEIVQGLVTSVAVLQVQVTHLTEGLKAAGEELDQLRETLRATLQ
jgi:uncharacterized membrane protein YeaQ/YmgE (transglycosylase-associated protein family)